MVAGMRTESESLKGKDGRKRRSIAINLGAEQERSSRGIESFWRSSALCFRRQYLQIILSMREGKKVRQQAISPETLGRVRRRST
jgi:hypothetical protein